MAKYILLFLFSSHFLFASIVGNPSSPVIFNKGLFFKNRALDLRAGYYFSNIYRAEFEDEIITEDSSNSYLKLVSQGAILTLDFKRWLDIYALVGNSKLKIERQIRTNENLSWAVGARALLFKIAHFDFTLSGAYFRSKMDTSYFLIDDLVFPILTENFGFLYEEYQTSFAISYRIKNLIPYLGTTYLYSNTLTPSPSEKGLLRFPYPNQDLTNDFFSSKIKNSKNWGVVAGVTLISDETINLNLESRMLDQNAFNISSELKF